MIPGEKAAQESFGRDASFQLANLIFRVRRDNLAPAFILNVFFRSAD
jgi:hypothetical protein